MRYNMTNKQIYEKVNQKIMDLISKGTMPWEMSWEGSTLPMNLASNTNYRGINVWMLSATAMFNGYQYNQWLTFNQTKKLGGAVKEGEKASFVVFAKRIEKKGQDNVPEDERESFFLYQYYNVFNVAQCEGITPIETNVRKNTPLEEAEAIVVGYKNKPEIICGQYSPCYSPLDDKVFMPTIESFTSSEEYYGALFHELAHSTGHKSRMNRELAGNMDKTSYSKEELIAEFTASYLRAMTGIATPNVDANSASYIDGWSDLIKKDYQIIMNSASKAMRVADYILGKKE
jgi:antirestriction protein ArdC